MNTLRVAERRTTSYADSDGQVMSLQQNMLANLAGSACKPARDPDTRPASSPDDGCPYPQVVQGLIDYLNQHPDSSPQALDQEVGRLFQTLEPDQRILVIDKQLVVGYAFSAMDSAQQGSSDSGPTHALKSLQTDYLMVGQFEQDWGQKIFQKPDDEDKQW